MRIRGSFPVSVAPTQQSLTLPKRTTSWRLVNLAIGWSTDATVQNRILNLQIADGGGNLIAQYAASIITASRNVFSSFSSVGQTYDVATGAFTFSHIGIPDDLWLQPNWTASYQIFNAAPGDSVASVLMLIEFFTKKKSGSDEIDVVE
jgi:hypothetical protein